MNRIALKKGVHDEVFKHLVFLTALTCVIGFSPTLTKSASNQKYHRTEIHSYKKIKATDDLKFIFLCIPPTNDYQDVSNVDPHGAERFKRKIYEIYNF